MEEMKNVPEIRFGEFKDNWNKKELDDEVDFYSGLTYSPKDVQKESGTFVIRSSNVKNNQLVEADDVFVNPDIVNSLNVEQGDIAVVVRNGSRHLIGKHAQIKTKLDNTVIGAFMTGLRPKNNSDFVNALLNTQTFQKEIEKNLGATINQITTGPFKKMEFFFPEPNEQIVIGDFVKNLNVSIKNHQTQLKKLTNLKKAMLIKMFPQDGASLPEIRFKGFDGEWESHKINSIAELNPKANLPERFNYVDLESVSGTQIIGSKNILKEFAPSRAQRLAKKGDLFYQTVRPYQKNNCLFDKAEKDFVFSTGYAQLRPSVNNHFLFAILQREAFVHEVMIRCTGTSYPAISSSDLGGIEIMVSNDISEQFKIGKYFKYLDFLIENNNEQLKKLNQIKKACLSKLFVSQD